MNTLHGYLAFPGFLEDLLQELKFAGIKPKKMVCHGNLVLVDGFKRKPVWARNVWGSVEQIHIESVSDAIRKLKALGLRWALCPNLHHRRAELIVRGLKVPKFAPLKFPIDSIPTKNLGSFMMVSETSMLASVHCSQPVPNGSLEFAEDKTSPPTRAYLKLWEVFTRLGKMPSTGDHCVDLGSCPGGWTWVLAKLGASVVSVDRTEIDPSVLAMPGVEFVQGNAFAFDPKSLSKVDWFFSDLICEPGKLFELVQRWISIHSKANFVCSVKFKGETDFKVVNAFMRIAGSMMIHLNNNKHEVTWVRLFNSETVSELDAAQST